LFTGGLILLYRQRWVWFYAIYILLCVNKETSVLMTAVFLFWQGRQIIMDRKLAHLILMMLLWTVTEAWLSHVYQGNPGSDREWHLMRNAAFSFSMLGWLRLAALAATIGVCAVGWSESPRFVRMGLLATLPVLFLATIFWGYIDEWRDYYEALPFMAALCMGAFLKIKNKNEKMKIPESPLATGV
jgi:hypothetical protein